MTEVKEKQQDFRKVLAKYKTLIDSDIEKYCEEILSETYEQFGEFAAEPVKAYCELLSRGGKRVRGILTMVSYYMLGGKDDEVALKAARAIEMLHAYILMVDDIQDRSDTRRGGPTAHKILEDYHKSRKFKDDSEHFGKSLTKNGFLFGAHKALNIITELDVSAEKKIAAIENINTQFIFTVHGQTQDLFNEVIETENEDEVEQVLLLKTAYYTFMNPLQLGAILAGASNRDLELMQEFSFGAGRAFQITDDIIGIFGDDKVTGKSALDDIIEGKRTILTVNAIKNAPKADSYYLTQMLGNRNLSHAEFEKCQKIITESGALKRAQDQAVDSAEAAKKVLETAPENWDSEHIEFLDALVDYVVNRKS